MRISSQLLLTFLLNACWQIALIAALAGFGSMLLRNSVARYRHVALGQWLCLAFLVPAITSSRVLLDDAFKPVSTTEIRSARGSVSQFATELAPEVSAPCVAPASTFQLNQTFALALLAIYFGFLLYRSFKLV